MRQWDPVPEGTSIAIAAKVPRSSFEDKGVHNKPLRDQTQGLIKIVQSRLVLGGIQRQRLGATPSVSQIRYLSNFQFPPLLMLDVRTML